MNFEWMTAQDVLDLLAALPRVMSAWEDEEMRAPTPHCTHCEGVDCVSRAGGGLHLRVSRAGAAHRAVR
jgi:hypothetical protein